MINYEFTHLIYTNMRNSCEDIRINCRLQYLILVLKELGEWNIHAISLTRTKYLL